MSVGRRSARYDDDRQPRLGSEQVEGVDGSIALLFPPDDGEQAGQQPLQDDAGSERLGGGDLDEAAQHLVVRRGMGDLEAGELEQLVEGTERRRRHAPRPDAVEHGGSAAQLAPLSIEAGGEGEADCGVGPGVAHGVTVTEDVHRRAHCPAHR